MTAATLGRSPARGFDRLVLLTGLALVAWSRRHAERRLHVVPASRSIDLHDPDRPQGLADPRSVESLMAGQGAQYMLFR